MRPELYGLSWKRLKEKGWGRNSVSKSSKSETVQHVGSDEHSQELPCLFVLLVFIVQIRFLGLRHNKTSAASAKEREHVIL